MRILLNEVDPAVAQPGQDLTEAELAALYAYPEETVAERPWVRANFVTTLDGAVTGDDGRSGSINTGADRIQLMTGPGISARVQLLAPDGTSPMVNIATGAGRLTGGAFPAAAGLNVFAPDGTPIGRLGTGNPANDVAPDGLNLLLRDRQGRNRIALVVAPDGTPSIELLDEAGRVTWRVP